MGRYIECEVNGELEIVWKYEFGVQESEMHRVYEELGIGEYHAVRYEFSDDEEEDEDDLTYEYLETRDEADGEILILRREDLEELRRQLEALKQDSERSKETWFIAMTETILDFTLRYPGQEEFTFTGEF